MNKLEEIKEFICETIECGAIRLGKRASKECEMMEIARSYLLIDDIRSQKSLFDLAFLRGKVIEYVKEGADDYCKDLENFSKFKEDLKRLESNNAKRNKT